MSQGSNNEDHVTGDKPLTVCSFVFVLGCVVLHMLSLFCRTAEPKKFFNVLVSKSQVILARGLCPNHRLAKSRKLRISHNRHWASVALAWSEGFVKACHLGTMSAVRKPRASTSE